MAQPTCPDCNVEMESGFIPDSSFDRVVQTCWHRGSPQNQRILGLKTPSGAIKFEPKEMLGITTYRCTSCGLLRSYAEAQHGL